MYALPLGRGFSLFFIQMAAFSELAFERAHLNKKRHPAEVSTGKESPPNGVRRVIKELRRGAGNRSARVLILTKSRCQGREKFCSLCKQNFSAQFLDKRNTRGNSGLFQAVLPFRRRFNVHFDRARLNTTFLIRRRNRSRRAATI